MRIIIFGPYPKPYGGISVHIRNFNLFYQKFYSKKIGITIFNTSENKQQVDYYSNVKKVPCLPLLSNDKREGTNSQFYALLNSLFRSIWLTKSIITQKADILHFQGSANWAWRALIVILAKITNKKSILSIHGAGRKSNIFSQELPCKISLRQKIYWFFIKKYDNIICDNSYQIRNLKLYHYNNEKISFITEFIPPIKNDGEYLQIPKYIQNFYEQNEINLYGMGWITSINGIDLYGLDMMLKLMSKIKKLFPNHKIGLTLKIIGASNKSIEKLNQIIDVLQLNNILVVDMELNEIYPLIEKADIMIRPSCTDGDSVSIREALYFNTPVVTSDAIKRPDGCILFRNRNQNDFEKKVLCLINAILKSNIKEKKKNNFIKNNAELIMKLYQKVNSTKKKKKNIKIISWKMAFYNFENFR